MSIMLTRKCSKCKCDKPLAVEFFYRCKSSSGGFVYECKVCYTNRRNTQHHTNIRKRINQRYYLKNREKCLIKKNAWKKLQRLKDPVGYARMYKNAKLKKFYGITIEDYDALYRKQQGLCKICENPPTVGNVLHVDHIKNSRIIRGLLCHSCNRGIGLLRHNTTILNSAIKYLSSAPVIKPSESNLTVFSETLKESA